VDPTFSQPLTSRIGTPITALPQVARPDVLVVCSVEVTQAVGLVRECNLSRGVTGIVTELRPGVIEVALLDVEQRADADMISGLVRHVCAASGYTVRDEISRRRAGSRYGNRVVVENRRGVLIPYESPPWEVMTVIQKTLAYIEGDGNGRRVRRALPGEWRGSEREEFVERARHAGVSENTIFAVIERWRGRVRYIHEMERSFEEVCPGVLRGEIALAIVSDQVTSLEDLLFGSLALYVMPGWHDLVAPIAAALAETGAVDSKALNLERVFTAMSVTA
jgi:hypothetical protein